MHDESTIITDEDKALYQWNRYWEGYFQYDYDTWYTPDNASYLTLNTKTKTVNWTKDWDILPWKKRYKAFKVNCGEYSNYGSYYNSLVFEYKDKPFIDIEYFTFFMANVDICLHVAEESSNPVFIRQYLLEAQKHYETASRISANAKIGYPGFCQSQIDKYKQFLAEDESQQSPEALLTRLKIALSNMPAEPVKTSATSKSYSQRAKNPPLTISAMARTSAAPKQVLTRTNRVTSPAVTEPTSTKLAPAKPATRLGIPAKTSTAQQALEREEYATAETLFEKLCIKEPKNIEAFIGHGLSLLKLASQCDKPKTKKKQLVFAEAQLKKAEALDTKGRYPKIEELLTETESLLQQVADIQPNTSPTNSGSLTGSRSSEGTTLTAHTPETLVTTSDYKITFSTKLGEGAAGAVYLGTWNDTTVAIKHFHATQLRGDDLREFLREANFMMDLNSPYLVRMLDFVAQAPHYCLVMEYMSMGSLYQVLGSDVELPTDKRWGIAMDIAYGVAALHSKDIVHRDIKSLNVLIGNGFRAKLADFGQAKLKSSSHSVKTRRSETGAVGTTAWLAPEILRERAECSKATDMYSLGMVLWELFTRETPFANAPNEAVIMHWISLGKQEDITKVQQPKLSNLILSCWQSNPDLSRDFQAKLN